MKKHNRMKQVLLMALLLIAGYTPASAQTRPLTLAEAVSLGVQNSSNLKLSNEKINEATAVLAQSKENRLPEASISGAYLRLTEPKIDMKAKLGGSSEGSGSGGEQSSGSAIKVDQVMYGMANVSLPLFSGFRIQSGIESSKYLLEAS